MLRDGITSAAVSVFRGILSRKELRDRLADVLAALGSEPEAAPDAPLIQMSLSFASRFGTALQRVKTIADHFTSEKLEFSMCQS
jgi:hypothetical protein